MNAFCSHVCAAACGPSVLASAHEHATATLPVPSLLPLDFTFVLYDAESSWSLFLAFMTFVPILLVASVFVALLMRRDLEAGWQLAGFLISSAINAVLKRWWAEHRPLGSAKLGFGMPSDHAQASTFFVVYAAVWISRRTSMAKWMKAALLLSISGTALVVAYSRVHLGVHSVKQVCAGGAVGALFGAFWSFVAVRYAWPSLFPLLESSWIGRLLFLKDGATASLPAWSTGAAHFEYEMYQRWKREHAKEIEDAYNKAAAEQPTQQNGTAGPDGAPARRAKKLS